MFLGKMSAFIHLHLCIQRFTHGSDHTPSKVTSLSALLSLFSSNVFFNFSPHPALICHCELLSDVSWSLSLKCSSTVWLFIPPTPAPLQFYIYFPAASASLCPLIWSGWRSSSAHRRPEAKRERGEERKNNFIKEEKWHPAEASWSKPPNCGAVRTKQVRQFNLKVLFNYFSIFVTNKPL